MKPTVTELIKLLDKPALLKWANKIGLDGIKLEDYRKDKMQSGTSLHNQIECYLQYKKPFEDNLNQLRFDNFIKDKEVLFIEKNIETDWFIGRLDLMFNCKNESYICDFKSNQRAIYFENKLQLIAYRMALKCDKIAIISIPDFTLMNVYIKEYGPYEEILKALSIIYNNKKLIDL